MPPVLSPIIMDRHNILILLRAEDAVTNNASIDILPLFSPHPPIFPLQDALDHLTQKANS
jgi:hypothetical protein